MLAPFTNHQVDVDARRQGVGGSDIGAILGLNPFRTALDVYREKLGEDLFAGNERTRWGDLLEDVIATRYAEETRHNVGPGGLFINPSAPWHRGNLDRVVYPDNGKRRVLECKTSGWRQAHEWGEQGTDQIPETYLAQCHWYLSLPEFADVEAVDVPVLIEGSDFRVYTVMRDEAFERELVERGRAFWHDHVLAKNPPPVDGSESSAAYLKARFPKNLGTMLTSTPETDAAAEVLRSVRAALKEAEGKKALLEAQLKAIIGTADGISGEWGKVTWKSQAPRKTVDVKALVKHLGLSDDDLAPFTKETPMRVFRCRFVGDADE
jgi:putative phage-type endonuclease